ncbi:DNA topoisomerase III [Cytobacillus oceanisediminis]|uniref:type IA DNA topoisomerase n=1 Tax=Cytobacillus oceanisediminis TaxID=665099 RepID=UPI001C24CC9F|nr:type IA DNA topoisomerase [Cytobacillus oceanisediminis]MBU8732506.1 DNA topoisomerase III [Cytobacillus oceanisediminis]
MGSSSLILAEKPSQAQAYASAFKNVKRHEGYYDIPSCSIFPGGAKLTWGIGHLVTLKEPHEYSEEWAKWNLSSLPVIPEKFQFKVANDKQKQFNIVKSLLSQTTGEVIVATDCDREGENIARSIITLAGASNKPTKRLWINSLEEDEVIRGFKNLKEGAEYIPYAYEAQARQISDWLVGLNMSRLYTLLLNKKGVKGENGKNVVFPVGRVQTPTLVLIYERQKEIENFKPQPFFELESLFKAETGTYKGKFKGKYDTKSELQDLLRKHNINSLNTPGNIKDVKKELKKSKSPKLLSLSSLQILANKKYKYSPNQVLKIVQSLYDNPLKLVTYPRTDTPYITENEFDYLRDNIANYQNITNDHFEPHTLESNKRYVNNALVQEHYAIVPTRKIPSETILKELTTEQKNIYFEVIKSALGMFHAPYEYEETTIITDVNGMQFETVGKVEKSKGWKELYAKDPKDEENEEIAETLLPNVSPGMTCQAALQIKEGKTSKPKQYTEGDLIPLMRDCGKKIKDIDEESKSILNEVEGLGTEATRSNIIESLKNQRYIEIKKNKVYVTKKGEILCKAVEGTLLAKPELTAKWESYLKKIGKKEGKKETFIVNTINFTKTTVEATKKSIETLNIDSTIKEMQTVDHIALCPSCKKGYITDKQSFYGCSEYRNGCKQTFPKKKNEKTITKNQIKQLCEKGKTSSKIKGFKKKESTDKFDAFLELKDGKLFFAFK